MEKYMLKNCSEEYNGDVLVRNKDKWTLADLSIRQYLNNQCDGFGLYNVKDVYNYLVKNREKLIANRMVSPEGRNNFGCTLWKKYEF